MTLKASVCKRDTTSSGGNSHHICDDRTLLEASEEMRDLKLQVGARMKQ